MRCVSGILENAVRWLTESSSSVTRGSVGGGGSLLVVDILRKYWRNESGGLGRREGRVVVEEKGQKDDV